MQFFNVTQVVHTVTTCAVTSSVTQLTFLDYFSDRQKKF